MCRSSKPKAPPPVPEAPKLPDASEMQASSSERRRRRAAAGDTKNNTILTSPRGVSDSTGGAGGKTLLGG